VADGRPVDARINANGQWEAHVTRDHWPLAHEEKWVEVPSDRVLRHANPVGVPILWYGQYTDSVFCFAPASGI
jgi:hypothetical protein